MNESVVERSLNVADTEDVLSVLAGLGVRRTVVDHLLLLLLIGLSLLLGGLWTNKKNAQTPLIITFHADMQ